MRPSRTMVVGPVVGLLAAVAFEAVAELGGVNLEKQVAILVGVVGTLTGAVVAGHTSLMERVDLVRQHGIDAAALRSLGTMPDAERVVAEIAVGLKAIDEEPDQRRRNVFWQLATSALEQASADVRAAADGAVLCADGDEKVVLRFVLTNTAESVRAVATRGRDWWQLPDADAYFDYYSQHARRLRIERVFVLDCPLDDTIVGVLERHRRARMHTFYVQAADLQERLRRPIVLFDAWLLHMTHPVTGRVEFTASRPAIATAENQWDEIRRHPMTMPWRGPR